MGIRDYTSSKYDNLQLLDARDITLIRWEHSGEVELLSCSGEVIFDGEVYMTGEIAEYPSIIDQVEATIRVNLTNARVAEVENDTWRDGTCKIYKLPVTPGDDNTYVAGDEYLQLDGLIDSSTASRSSGTVTVRVIQKDIAGSRTPRLTANQFFTSVLTAGSIVVNDNDVIVLETVRRNDVLVEKRSSGIRGALSMRRINEFREDGNEIRLNGSASGAHVPIPFGPVPVPGRIVDTWVDGSDTLFLVLFGHGELYEYDQVFINNAVPTSGVEIHFYRGGVWQGVDSWINDVDGTYADTGVYLDAKGQIGASYIVARIPASELGGVPFFQALVKGCLVFDPDSSSTGDPYYDDVGVSVHFTGTNGQTSATDDSTNGHTITFNGSAQIQGNELELDDATGDSVTIADHPSLRPGSGSWTIETRFEPDDISGAKTLFERYGGSSSRSIRCRQIDNDVYLYLADTATTTGIHSGLIGQNVLVANTQYDLKVEFDAMLGQYVAWLDGAEIWRLSDSTVVFENGEDWTIGDGFDGTIECFRFTQGHLRYGGCQTITASPFSDSASYQAGYVYSANGALIQAEIQRNAMFGSGVTIDGLEECKDWNDSILDTEPRCELSLLIATSRPTIEWTDYLTEYTDCFLFPEGSGMKMVPNKPVDAENPSGQELVANPNFEEDASSWVLGAGCSYNGTWQVLVWNGSQTAESKSYTLLIGTEPGEPVALKLSVALRTAGSVRVDVNLVEVISAKSAAGNYYAEYIPNSTAVLIQIVADADFVGWVSACSLRRYYWLSEGSVGNSLEIAGVSNANTPTRMEGVYRAQDNATANWQDTLSTAYQLPGVESGDVRMKPSLLYIQNFFKAEQANNYVLSRLYRMRDRKRVTWVERDFALLFRKGTVIHKRDVYSGIDGKYRALNVTCFAQGRYQVVAENYDLAHWPSEQGVSVSGATIPVGAIVLCRDAVAPSGWAIYSDADGRFIRGTTDTSEVDTTGGSASYAGFTENTEDGGGHGSVEHTPFYLAGLVAQGGAVSGTLIAKEGTDQGVHNHSVATGSLSPDIYRREQVLIKKTGSPGSSMPVEALVFGLAGLNVPNLVRDTNYQNRLLMANSANANDGSAQEFIDVTTGSGDDRHKHITETAVSDAVGNSGFSPPAYPSYSEGGSVHTHQATLRVLASQRRILLALYSAIDDYDLDQGMFFLWDDAIANQTDADWTLCDGTLGTPDVHNRCIEISKSGSEGSQAGNDTIRVYGQTDDSDPHDHPSGTPSGNAGTPLEPEHSQPLYHRHDFDQSDDYEAPWHKFALFMLNPNPVLGFIDVALLISGGEADGATTIVDDSSFNLSPDTVSGSPEYDDAQTLFSLNAILNASGDRLHYASFAWGRKFTMEGFFRLASSTSGSLFSNGTGTEKWEVRYNAGVGLEFVVDGVVKDTTADPGTGVWFYVAVNYDAAEFRFYYGLQSVGTAALQHTETDAIAALADDLYVGDNAALSSSFDGHYIQVRATRGAARHSGSVVAIPISAFATS